MLTKLIITNFQAHKKLVLDLDARVTTIVGTTDKGKSSVIRALTWLATNRPSGTEFIRYGSSQTTVELHVDDHVIIRERGKSINRYVLDDQEFKAFGTEPPQEVLDVLNLSAINFQAQHDSPFWFQESPGEVSRQLNEIVDLSVIDSTLANLDRTRREAMTKVKVLEEEVAGASTLRSSLAWAKTAAEDLGEVEEYHTVYIEANGNCRRLENLMGPVDKYGSALKKLRASAVGVENTVRIGESWYALWDERTRLDRLLVQLQEQQTVVSRPIPDPSPLIKAREAWGQITEQVQMISYRINDVGTADKEVETTTEKALTLEKQFKTLMGKACPLCGHKL
ncbi:MAG TPA: AAA family ATPase [Dehalococcoidia bacterium]|nr:AAA family ATPase [Dehalococcoidia bacterium]